MLLMRVTHVIACSIECQLHCRATDCGLASAPHAPGPSQARASTLCSASQMSAVLLGLVLGLALANGTSIIRQVSRLWTRGELYEDDREALLLNLSLGTGTRWMNMGQPRHVRR